MKIIQTIRYYYVYVFSDPDVTRFVTGISIRRDVTYPEPEGYEAVKLVKDMKLAYLERYDDARSAINREAALSRYSRARMKMLIDSVKNIE